MNAYAQLLTKAASSQTLSRVAQRLLPEWVTIFMLHRLEVPEIGVSGIKPELLERCLEYLCENGYRFISLEDAVQRALAGTLEREKWVAFSLDDGFAEQVTLAGNIFAKFNCPSTCFLLTGFVDGQLWQWEHQINYLLGQTAEKSLTAQLAGGDYVFNLEIPKAHRPIIAAIRKLTPSTPYEVVNKIAASLEIHIPTIPPENERPATWDEIRAMELKGMLFGPHTVTHRIVSGLSDEDQAKEIANSFIRIRQECANPSNIFCYPSGQQGQFDERMFDKLRSAGVTAAFSALPGYLTGPEILADLNYRYAIPRLSMPESFGEFQRYVSWAQYLYEKFNRGKSRHQGLSDYCP